MIEQRNRLHLRIASISNIPKISFLGKANPYCLVQLGQHRNIDKTKVFVESFNPVWNDEFHFKLNGTVPEDIHIVLRSKEDSSIDTPIAKCDIKYTQADIDQVFEREAQMISLIDGKAAPTIKYVIHYSSPGALPFKPGAPAGKVTADMGEMANEMGNMRGRLADYMQQAKRKNRVTNPPPINSLFISWFYEDWFMEAPPPPIDVKPLDLPPAPAGMSEFGFGFRRGFGGHRGGMGSPPPPTLHHHHQHHGRFSDRVQSIDSSSPPLNAPLYP